MWRSYFQKWSPPVLAALGVYLGLGGTPVQAQHLGHKQAYDVVQGYIVQCQAQTQACVPSQTPAASAQNQTTSLAVAPQAPQAPTQTVTLQLAQQAPVQTLQLAAQPVLVQTMQLAAQPVQMQTLQLAAQPVQVQTVQLAAQPVQMQTLQLAAQPVATQCAVPVTLLLPRHKCHFFCRHYNCTK
jgi:hypothetical protein